MEANALLAEGGIPVIPTALARDPEEAIHLADTFGYPVVLKLAAASITHKSDVGGVALNLANADAVHDAFHRIRSAALAAAPDAAVQGVSVQPLARPGTEVIIGLTQDPQFGPVLMFGLGGVLVEALKDVAFRIVPLDSRDARQMIGEIQAFPLLQGYRGAPPADLDALEALLLKLSAFAQAHPEIRELDLNPVVAHAHGATAVDVSIVLS